ncbi:MAG: hypothetical protein HYU85_05615 [Chloroflexi bacterium]|nr:hypothetical protein [Chloroflexota bacterium]MBI3040434.1 hypothetical protein [Chloroflexota bacterium]MBI3931465.1 hypothetical protein [Chloroflexota bacterium]
MRYHDRIQFLDIYIREAHPLDGWRLPETTAPAVYDPKTIKERRSLADRCQTDLKYEIPTYVDEMGDTVNQTYAAHPTRLYLIGLDGRVVYPGAIGPRGFKPAELEEAIVKYLTRVEVAAG